MGRKKDREKQQELWVAASEIVTTPGHVFYERLNTVLNAEKFDQRIEAICRKYYKSSSGRPSITPGTYFRMLLLGYFEGIDSERGMAWRAADSLSFRKFLGYDFSEPTPDHSTVSRTRRLYSPSAFPIQFRQQLLTFLIAEQVQAGHVPPGLLSRASIEPSVTRTGAPRLGHSLADVE